MTRSDVTAPLEAFLGFDLAAQLRAGAWPSLWSVTHGPLTRLPAALLNGKASTFQSLAKHYTGEILASRGGQQLNVDLISRNAARTAGQLRAFGLTLFFTDLRGVDSSLDDLLNTLAMDIGGPAGVLRACAFASATGGGAPLHYDATANVIVQLAGRKVVGLAAAPFMYPMFQYMPGMNVERDRQWRFPGGVVPVPPQRMENINLDPGSVLFIPAGCWHRTRVEQDSFSVSLVFELPRVVDIIISQLRDELSRFNEYRRPASALMRTETRGIPVADILQSAIHKLIASIGASLNGFTTAETNCSGAASLSRELNAE